MDTITAYFVLPLPRNIEDNYPIWISTISDNSEEYRLNEYLDGASELENNETEANTLNDSFEATA